jgi:hypothetical protein
MGFDIVNGEFFGPKLRFGKIQIYLKSQTQSKTESETYNFSTGPMCMWKKEKGKKWKWREIRAFK